jgi:DNA repair photolyase
MAVIYQPAGKAREYAPLACNLYRGCGHGCVYCYAPSVLKLSREAFANAQPRSNILGDLERAAKKMTPANVLLCFTTDPYQPIEAQYGITREAVHILHRWGWTVTILTKGASLARRDFDLLGPGDVFATSLTLRDSAESMKWEPGASLPEERIEALRDAHSRGLSTWVSLEPVIDPEAVYAMIEETHSFVDLYKVGTLNYHTHAKTIDWREFARKVVEVLESNQAKYYLKEDLRKWIPSEAQPQCSSIETPRIDLNALARRATPTMGLFDVS